MKSTIDCVHCYLKQAVSFMRLAGTDIDKQYDYLYELMDFVRTFDKENTPAENSSLVLLKIRELTGVMDPYKKEKKLSNDMALSLYPALKQNLDNTSDRLLDALKISVAGNIIDLGINRSYDIEAALKHSMEEGFAVNHYEKFVKLLSGVDDILILGDNAGEIVFDRILVEELASMGKKIIYVVKESPILNDATMEDALYIGMDKVARVITNGSDLLGTCLHNISAELSKLLREMPLIISKGQANFESLEQEKALYEKAYFILKLKCHEVAAIAGCEFGDTAFFTRNGGQ